MGRHILILVGYLFVFKQLFDSIRFIWFLFYCGPVVSVSVFCLWWNLKFNVVILCSLISVLI